MCSDMRSIPNNEELFEVTVGCQTFSYEQSPLRTFPHPFNNNNNNDTTIYKAP